MMHISKKSVIQNLKLVLRPSFLVLAMARMRAKLRCMAMSGIGTAAWPLETFSAGPASAYCRSRQLSRQCSAALLVAMKLSGLSNGIVCSLPRPFCPLVEGKWLVGSLSRSCAGGGCLDGGVELRTTGICWRPCLIALFMCCVGRSESGRLFCVWASAGACAGPGRCGDCVLAGGEGGRWVGGVAGVCLTIVGGLEAAGRAGIDDSIERMMPGVRVGTGGSARGGTGGIVSTGLPCD